MYLIRITKKNIMSFNIALIVLLYLASVISNNISIPYYGRLSNAFYLLILFVFAYLFFKNLTNSKVIIILPFFIRISLILMLIFSFLGGLITQDIRPIYTYYSFIFIFLTYWKLALDTTFSNEKVGLIVIKSIIVINFLFLLASLGFDGIYFYRYEGIFDMPNSMGRFTAYSLLISIAYLLFSGKSGRFQVIILLVIFMSFLFLILSNSRAPILAAFISVMVLMSTYARVKRQKIKVLFQLLLIGAIVSLIAYYFLYEIIEYFIFKFNRGDGTSGRFQLWQSGLKYFNFFGSIEYNNISSRYDVHNNYLSQALKYGLVPSIVFHGVPVYLFVKSYKRSLQLNEIDFNLAMVLSMSSFLLVYYMFETASIIAPYWLMIFFSVCSYNKIFSR